MNDAPVSDLSETTKPNEAKSAGAFLGQVVLKAELLEKLSKFPDDAKIGELVYSRENGASFVGAAIGAADVALWQSKLGLPLWLALAIDGFIMSGSSVKDGWSKAIDLLKVIKHGADISAKAHAIIAHCLVDGDDAIINTTDNQALKDICQKVAQMHFDALNGQEIKPSQWRALRSEAIAIADGFDGVSADGVCANCIEAACWNAVKSRSSVQETLNLWHKAQVAKHGYPWSEEYDQMISKRLEELHNEEKPKHPEGTFIDVFKLLEEKSPEIAKKMNDRFNTNNKVSAIYWQRRYERLLDGLIEVPPLLQRNDLFANPDRAAMKISPDGKYMAWLQNSIVRDEELGSQSGVMNIWAAPVDNMTCAKQVTFDIKRGIHGFFWSFQEGILLYSEDANGDENWHIFAADVASDTIKQMTPDSQGVRSTVEFLSKNHPDEIVISINQRDPHYGDIYILNILNGDIRLVKENHGYARFVFDDDYNIRIAIRPDDKGGADIFKCKNDEMELWISVGLEDVNLTGPAWFSADGKIIYFYDSRGRDKSALTAIDWETNEQTIIAESELADIGGVIDDSVTYRPLAYVVTYDKSEKYLLDDTLKSDIEFIDNSNIGEWYISGRTADDKTWLINAGSDTRPAALYVYKRANNKSDSNKALEKIYDMRPNLLDKKLARMQPVIIKSRDGLDLVSYITIPTQYDCDEELKSLKPLPLILMVHGGPWGRDGFGYNPMHQWFANRGYAVLSVNFRASTGFGKSFLRAGDGEWGGKMDNDLIDAVNWAINKGIADANKIAIFGGSYGGFAVLSGMTNNPDFYACGIDIVGPSNLETLLASIPPYWESERIIQYRAIGNPETEEGRAFLKERSPLFKAAAIKKPLMIAQGGNDPRVKQAEAEQMVAALKEHSIPNTYALFPDEGHGFVREANRMQFNALVDSFLAKHLGGRCEEWSNEDFKGTSLILQES